MDVFGLDFRVAEVGGGLLRDPRPFGPDGRLLGQEMLPLLGKGGPVTFLLHGFNNSRTRGREALLGFAQLVEQDAPDLDARLAAVLWPGDDLLSPVSYSLEERDARRTAAHLALLLLDTWKVAEAPSFVAHSLGCLVALETMKLLADRGLATDQALLLAGAVDADALARSDRYRGAIASARHVFVLHSRADKTLKWAFPAGDSVAALIFGGYTRRALGLSGPERGKGDGTVPANVSPLNLTGQGVDHGDYLPGKSAGKPQRCTAHYAAEVLRRVPSPSWSDGQS